MSSSHGELLAALEPATLGARIRDARLSRGLTQTDLAGESMTVSYVSRIESGARRPKLAVVRTLAGRLDLTVDQLLRGVTACEYDEIRLGLDYAELALETGEAAEAAAQARTNLTRAESANQADLVARGRYLLGRALEAVGRLDEAIDVYETLTASATGLLAIECGIALSRAYRESDDLTLAIEAGERVQATLAGSELEATDEAVRLAVTIALAYAVRGDLGRATRLGTEAVERAERLDSPAARAAAYWNASVFQAQRGDIELALPLASRALAMLAEGRDARNLARLRLQIGNWQMSTTPPDFEQGIANISAGRDGMANSSTTGAELAEADIALSRALSITGDATRALDLADQAQAKAPDRSSLVFAEALVARAHALAALAQTDAARQSCTDAMGVLDQLDSNDRFAAQSWFDLANLLKDLGDHDNAWTALQNVAASTGFRAAPQHQDRREDMRSSVGSGGGRQHVRPDGAV